MARKQKAMSPEPKLHYVQQVHKNCGGEIVVVAENRTLALCCRKCEVVWNFASPFTLAVCAEFDDGVKHDADPSLAPDMVRRGYK